MLFKSHFWRNKRKTLSETFKWKMKNMIFNVHFSSSIDGTWRTLKLFLRQDCSVIIFKLKQCCWINYVENTFLTKIFRLSNLKPQKLYIIAIYNSLSWCHVITWLKFKSNMIPDWTNCIPYWTIQQAIQKLYWYSIICWTARCWL